MSVYNNLLDKSIIRSVSDLFYEKVYDHPWISLYFKDIDQEFISSQQTDFVIMALGGPKNYSGRLPSNAHPHMVITEELFELRESLLKEALVELKAPQELIDAWLKVDYAHMKAIVRENESDCELRFKNDEILNFPNPLKKSA